MQIAAVFYYILIAVVDMDQGIIVQKWNSSLRCGKLLTSVKGDQPFMSTHLHTDTAVRAHACRSLRQAHGGAITDANRYKQEHYHPWTSQD